MIHLDNAGSVMKVQFGCNPTKDELPHMCDLWPYDRVITTEKSGKAKTYYVTRSGNLREVG